jgi:hypothetical protein
MRFDKSYFALTMLLFATEAFIGAYLHDKLIRPFGGDLLVVILIYCFVKSFFDTPWLKTAIATLLFAYLVEVSQYFNLLGHLGLQRSKMATILLGHSFSWGDMLCYTLGIAVVVAIEQLRRQPNPNLSKAKTI